MNHQRFIRSLLFLLNIVLVANTNAQQLPDSTIKKIDSIFHKWNNNYGPGCAIGIVRNDSLIYAKGYGLANLEYNVPITPETVFHLASVSKQFTGYSIVLLANQNKLKLDDDIRKYLPWFPDLKEKITIRHLLNHTSGIRDQWQLLAISGTRLDDVITQEHIIKLLSKQKALSFKPGEKESYSNSNYTLLAEIVKSVTGQSFRKFTDSAIFKPLGMNNTHFHDDYTEIVKSRAYSYRRIDSIRFANSILSYSNAGATSLFSNINDMAKWIMNFYTHKAGGKKDIDLLTQKGKLNNGRELGYAAGIAVSTYKGWKEFSHNGGDAGYRTFINVFPELKMGFIAFSNLNDLAPWNRAYEVADLLIKQKIDGNVAEAKKVDSSRAILKDTLRIKNYIGDYISEDGVRFSYTLANQKLYLKTPGQTLLLMKAEKDTFQLFSDPEVKFLFNITPEGTSTVTQYWSGNTRSFVTYKNTSLSDKQLQEYTGVYYSPELDTRYGIELKDNHLVLTNSKYSDAKLTLAGSENLLSNLWWMNHLQVKRNSKKQIIGFELNSGRIMHLQFDKIQ